MKKESENETVMVKYMCFIVN